MTCLECNRRAKYVVEYGTEGVGACSFHIARTLAWAMDDRPMGTVIVRTAEATDRYELRRITT